MDEAARGLLDHGRPAAALDLMQIYMHGERKRPDPTYVVEGLNALGSGEKDLGRLSTYEIEILISYLRETDVDEDEVAMLEWKLLPALGHEPRGLVLERKLARDPAFLGLPRVWLTPVLSQLLEQSPGKLYERLSRSVARCGSAGFWP